MGEPQFVSLATTWTANKDDPGEGDDGSGQAISIALDTEKNGDKSVFPWGGKAYFIVEPGTDAAYECESSWGTLRATGEIRRIAHAESLTFAKSKRQSLSREPVGAVSTKWIGREPAGRLRIDGGDFFLDKAHTGILLVEYETEAESWRLEADRPGDLGEDVAEMDIVVVAAQGDTVASATAKFGDTTEKASINIERFVDEEAGHKSGDLCWGESAYFLTSPAFIGADDPIIKVRSSWGSVRSLAKSKLEDVKEIVSFARSNEADLSSDPQGGDVTLRFLGDRPPLDIGGWAVDGRKIVTGNPIVGTAEATYKTRKSLWELIGRGAKPNITATDDEGNGYLPVVVYAFSDDDPELFAETQVVFSDAACEPDAGGPVKIQIVDLCGGGDPIAGSTLVLNGVEHQLDSGVLELEYVEGNTVLNWTASAPKCTPHSGSETVRLKEKEGPEE